MKYLTYKFDNPYCSCEKVLYCKETNRYYILQPCQNKGEQRLLTCSPSGGYYEADTPVREGLTYDIDGEIVTTLEEGIIRDDDIYNAWQNEEFELYRIKDEYKNIDNYRLSFNVDALLPRLYDYIDPEHTEKIIVKRKDVYRFFNYYYFKN